MLLKLKKILSPPVFPDSEKTRVAVILNTILLILLGFVLLTEPFLIYAVLQNNATLTLRVAAVWAPLALLFLLYILRKGYVQLTAWTFLLVQWLSTNLQVLVSGGLSSPALGAYVVSILLAGFLISKRIAYLFTGLSLGSILLVFYTETNHLLPPPTLFTTPTGKIRMLASILFVAAGVLILIIQSLDSAIQGFKHELAERVRIEKEREEVIRELEKRNIELERFNYTVSHELKTPIVTIKGFLGSIQQDLEKEHYEKAGKDLVRISSATDQMHSTLSDLLELSRLAHIININQEVNLNMLVKDALNTVAGRIRPGEINVQIAPNLPKVKGDPARLREVFENLLENAAKYMEDQTSPMIEIGVRNQSGEQIIFVKDNGMGIEPQYHSKIFGLFEKLDPKIEGTGIGLALVKRIIETHGGRIWVESEGLGKGSMFCFTIPEKS